MNWNPIAEYVRTSVAMIENSYVRFISDRALAPLQAGIKTFRWLIDLPGVFRTT